MGFHVISSNFLEAGVEALAVAVFKGEKATSAGLKEFDKLANGHIAAAIKSEEFKGETGDTALIRITPKGNIKASLLLLVGVGDEKEFNEVGVFITSGTATRYSWKCNLQRFAFLPRSKVNSLTKVENTVQVIITS